MAHTNNILGGRRRRKIQNLHTKWLLHLPQSASYAESSLTTNSSVSHNAVHMGCHLYVSCRSPNNVENITSLLSELNPCEIPNRGEDFVNLEVSHKDKELEHTYSKRSPRGICRTEGCIGMGIQGTTRGGNQSL